MSPREAEPQVRGLLTGFGNVALVWFDTPRMMTGDRAGRFTDLVRSLQSMTRPMRDPMAAVIVVETEWRRPPGSGFANDRTIDLDELA